MEPIQRPANVYVPRAVRYRIDARRVLESDKREDYQWFVKEYGLDIRLNQSNDKLRSAVLAASGGGAGAQIPVADGDNPIHPGGE